MNMTSSAVRFCQDKELDRIKDKGLPSSADSVVERIHLDKYGAYST